MTAEYRQSVLVDALPREHAGIAFFRRAQRSFKDQLTDAHAGPQNDVEAAVVDDFELKLAFETGVDRRRCDMHADTKSRQGTLSLDPARKPRLCREFDRSLVQARNN